ncbi:L-histidine N(alpha)-methyltransferase [Streptacidiphilus sp. N1-3]|uniref:L-histidine N(Alpha)-methyltransferase n=1 Tax=Streptacidiphilus alkalitolerans TaxID=3342712 RepID=A0ABV6XAS7_9ACTN
MTTTQRYTFTDRLPAEHYRAALTADISIGLAATPKTTSPMWFYDALGSKLYEEITRLPEYTAHRSEEGILALCADAVAEFAPWRELVDLGSGASEKTLLLLDSVETLDSYVALDVSASALHGAASRIAGNYPHLDVTALRTDFNQDLGLGDVAGERLIYFSGSTIGNLRPRPRRRFLRRLRSQMRPGDALLLGTDLTRAVPDMIAAYDDSQGLTAAWNLNLLAVLNRELGSGFDPDAFAHQAVWDASAQAIEMRLQSLVDQVVPIPALDREFHFVKGEEWTTETSAKFSPDRVVAELAAAGLGLRNWWTDAERRFGLSLSTVM